MKIQQRFVTLVCALCVSISMGALCGRSATAKDGFTLNVADPGSPDGYFGRTVTITGSSKDDVVLTWSIVKDNTEESIENKTIHVEYPSENYVRSVWRTNEKPSTVLVFASGYNRDRSYYETIPGGAKVKGNLLSLNADANGDDDNDSVKLTLKKLNVTKVVNDKFTVKFKVDCDAEIADFRLHSHGFYIKDGKRTRFKNASSPVISPNPIPKPLPAGSTEFTAEITAVDDGNKSISDPIRVVFFGFDMNDDRVHDSLRVRPKK